MWKIELQKRLCNRLGLTVTVCHYPTGCSKWNPIEHRLFSEISLNWSAQPLRTFEVMLGFIDSTSTKAGLKVTAGLLEGVFQKGQQVVKSVMKALNIEQHAVCPKWNYTIRPQAQAAAVG
jgi:Rhodopirellula transposase DDE domain